MIYQTLNRMEEFGNATHQANDDVNTFAHVKKPWGYCETRAGGQTESALATERETFYPVK